MLFVLSSLVRAIKSQILFKGGSNAIFRRNLLIVYRYGFVPCLKASTCSLSSSACC